MQWYPLSAAAMARPTPVLPLVPSTTVPPGLSSPVASAASMMAIPIRSFTDPPGLTYSALPTPGAATPAPAPERDQRGPADGLERGNVRLQVLRLHGVVPPRSGWRKWTGWVKSVATALPFRSAGA